MRRDPDATAYNQTEYDGHSMVQGETSLQPNWNSVICNNKQPLLTRNIYKPLTFSLPYMTEISVVIRQ